MCPGGSRGKLGRQTQEKPLEKSRLFKLACAKLCSGEPSSHAQRVAGAFDSHQECNCAVILRQGATGEQLELWGKRLDCSSRALGVSSALLCSQHSWEPGHSPQAHSWKIVQTGSESG